MTSKTTENGLYNYMLEMEKKGIFTNSNNDYKKYFDYIKLEIAEEYKGIDIIKEISNRWQKLTKEDRTTLLESIKQKPIEVPENYFLSKEKMLESILEDKVIDKGVDINK